MFFSVLLLLELRSFLEFPYAPVPSRQYSCRILRHFFAEEAPINKSKKFRFQGDFIHVLRRFRAINPERAHGNMGVKELLHVISII